MEPRVCALELGSQTTAPPFEGVSFLSGGGPPMPSAAEQRREFAMRKERDFLLTVKAREECAASCGISTGSGDC